MPLSESALTQVLAGIPEVGQLVGLSYERLAKQIAHGLESADANAFVRAVNAQITLHRESSHNPFATIPDDWLISMHPVGLRVFLHSWDGFRYMSMDEAQRLTASNPRYLFGVPLDEDRTLGHEVWQLTATNKTLAAGTLLEVLS
jgi:hypothetical protein